MKINLPALGVYQLSKTKLNDQSICLNEYDHALRALQLHEVFTVTKLANFLHQQYRAAANSLYRERKKKGALRHDHGFCDCYGKSRRYFMRRASWLLDPFGTPNGWKRRSTVEVVEISGRMKGLLPYLSKGDQI